MRRLHAGRFARLFAAGSAVFLGLVLPASNAVASPTVASLTPASITDPAYPDAPPGAYKIFDILPCHCGNDVTAIAYRDGYYTPPDTGFGRAKVLGKHNMYKPVVAFIVNARNHKPTGGKSFSAHAFAVHLVNGQVQRVLKIFAKYDERKLDDNHAFGIITAWCDGIQGACPQWVNEAINAQETPQTAWPANGTELTYSDPSSR
jgi:hypothetical protein